MRVLAALTVSFTIATTVRSFAPSQSVNNARPTATAPLSAGLFDNILFKTKEQVGKVEKSGTGNTGASVKKQLDGMLKKKKFGILIISSSAKDCIKGEKLISIVDRHTLMHKYLFVAETQTHKIHNTLSNFILHIITTKEKQLLDQKLVKYKGG